MTLDGYTDQQLTDMHRRTYDDGMAAMSKALDLLHQFSASPLSPEAMTLLADVEILKAKARELHQHLRAIGLEMAERRAAADAWDFAKPATSERLGDV